MPANLNTCNISYASRAVRWTFISYTEKVITSITVWVAFIPPQIHNIHMVMFENPFRHFNIFSRYSQQIVNQAIFFDFCNLQATLYYDHFNSWKIANVNHVRFFFKMAVATTLLTIDKLKKMYIKSSL